MVYFKKKDNYVIFFVLLSLIFFNFASSKTVETSLNIPNSPPVFSGRIPDILIPAGGFLVNYLDLKDYFSDPNGDTLAFNSTSYENITIIIEGSLVSFFPDPSFYGVVPLTFFAYDGEFVTPSNEFFINVTSDYEPPRWYDPYKNKEEIYQNSLVSFYTNWTDNFGLRNFIFSINQGNGWQQQTSKNFSGLRNVSFYNDFQISAAPGSIVFWKFEAFDLAGNYNVTDIQNFTVKERPITSPPDYGGIEEGFYSSDVKKGFFEQISESFLKVDKKEEFFFEPRYFLIDLFPGEKTSRVLRLKNNFDRNLSVKLAEKNLISFLNKISEDSFYLEAGKTKEVILEFFVKNHVLPNQYFGFLILEFENQTRKIPVVINLNNLSQNFFLKVLVPSEYKTVKPGNKVYAKIYINSSENFWGNYTLYYSIKSFFGETFSYSEEYVFLNNSFVELEKSLEIPTNLPIGPYIFYVRLEKDNSYLISGDSFEIGVPFNFFAIIKYPLIFILLLLLVITSFFLYYDFIRKRKIERIFKLYLLLNELKKLIEEKKYEEAENLFREISLMYREKPSPDILRDKELLKEEMKKLSDFLEKSKFKKEINQQSEIEKSNEDKQDLKKEKTKRKDSPNKKLFLLIFLFIYFFSFVSSFENEASFGKEIIREDYTISVSFLNRQISQGSIFSDEIFVTNTKDLPLESVLTLSDNLKEVVELSSSKIKISPKDRIFFYIIFKGFKEGNYSGNLSFSGDIIEAIPIFLSISNLSLGADFTFSIQKNKEKNFVGKPFSLKVDVSLLRNDLPPREMYFEYFLSSQKERFLLLNETLNISHSIQLLKDFTFPENLTQGTFYLEATALDMMSKQKVKTLEEITFSYPFLKRKIFGFLELRILFFSLFSLIFLILTFIFIKIRLEARKKYKMKLDKKSLPSYSTQNLYLGLIAETGIKAFFEPNRLSTHAIVAGATGGGKSISAQVIVEEALMKNIAVIVFDPTAQWSGMLRKCEDKKMLALYPKFGLKQTDARAFPGNIRPVRNAREIIDVNKFIKPGNIQIFTLNRLEPTDIDIFVASIIRQIFRSNPKESPDLKVLLVFDEVHRLLPKFGGSGEGFLQIERACREFRKWGFGVILISQVLSDFVGEIKANINTEIQARTIEESDLERIRLKYGEDYLKSLVRSEVGTVLFQNAEYNLGRPYFISFRPILHNTRRLSDEELEKYTSYNEVIDDLEFQIEELEKEKLDVFDLKMELKLVKDKLMSGNFSVVDIYLEGLRPRVQKSWEKLGKKPPKREIKLLDIQEIKKSVEEARKQRQNIEKSEKKNQANKTTKEENLEEKIIKPLTFDNGIMVSSLKELKGVIDNLDEEIFSTHVNKNKNDIADFIKQVFPKEAEELRKITNKEELAKKIKELGKK